MYLLPGLLVGLAYGAAPGPISIETLRQGTQCGIRHALAVQAGSAAGIAVYGGLAAFGAELLLKAAAWQAAAGLAGAAMLLWLGADTIRDRRGYERLVGARGTCAVPARRAMATGALLSLANPLDIVFWMSIGGSLIGHPGRDAVAAVGGFAAGLLAASLALAIAAGFWQSRLSDRAARLIAWACGVSFMGFGLHLGISTVQVLVAW
jgi:chemosensory pili system protein ChpE